MIRLGDISTVQALHLVLAVRVHGCQDADPVDDPEIVLQGLASRVVKIVSSTIGLVGKFCFGTKA